MFLQKFAAVTGFSLAMMAALPCGAPAQDLQPLPQKFAANDPGIQYIGRVDDSDPRRPRLAYPGTSIRFRFHGRSFGISLSCNSDQSALTVVVDHGQPHLVLLKKGENALNDFGALEDTNHTIEIVKRTETWQGIITLESVDLSASAALLPPPPRSARKLMLIGDSVTCGAGVNNNATCTPDPANPSNDAYASYGMLLGRRLDAETHLVCYGGRGLERDYRGLGVNENVLNAPQFLDLSVPSDAVQERAFWDASRWQPDLILISLGTNDFNLEATRPLDGAEWVARYAAFLRRVRNLYPQAQILITEGAIVTDPLLRELVQRAAANAKDSSVRYVPSAHYPGNGCNAHPTQAQHEQMADDFEPVIRRILGW